MTQDMETEIPLTRLETADDRFGTCPRCGGCDYFLNIGRAHWMVCERHRLKWPIGENLFRCWRFETEDDWRRNARTLTSYTEVRAAYRNTHILPDEVVAALDGVLDHFWGDEARDFLAAEAVARVSHVFRHMHLLDCWMKGIPQRLKP